MSEIIKCPICHQEEDYNPPDDTPMMYKCDMCNLAIYHPEQKEWYISLSFMIHQANRISSTNPELADKLAEAYRKSGN